jgi:hypothetical protein
MKTDTSLFLFEDAASELEITVDLAKIALMAKRAGGRYWIRMTGGDSLDVPPEPGLAIRTAWIAYQGKFNPTTDR